MKTDKSLGRHALSSCLLFSLIFFSKIKQFVKLKFIFKDKPI